jgi:putative SOS response-associated peptidase YedK
MCYYNGQKVTRAEYIRLKQLEKKIADFDFLNSPIHEGFLYDKAAILKPKVGTEDFDIVEMEWGFLPEKWYGKPIDSRETAERFRKGFPNLFGKHEPGITTLNATAEELLLPGKIYRESALERRCLMISTGFYEWRHIHRLNKKTGQPLKNPDKYPYRIGVKEKEYFYFPAVWKGWTDKLTGEYIETCANITTKANLLMEQVHNSKKRMPTILTEELAYEWMFGKLSEERILELASTQYPWQEMYAYTIAKDFRTALDPTAPFTYPEGDCPPIILQQAA